MAAVGTRRRVVAGMVGLMAARPGRAQIAARASPLTLSIVDAAGNLALTRPAFETDRKRNPKLVGRISCTAPPPRRSCHASCGRSRRRDGLTSTCC